MKQKLELTLKQKNIESSIIQPKITCNIEAPKLDIGNSCNFTPIKIVNNDGSINIKKENGVVYIDSNVVMTYASVYDFPNLGNDKSLYVDISTQTIYFWNGAYYASAVGSGSVEYDFDVLFDNALSTIKEIDGGSSINGN